GGRHPKPDAQVRTNTDDHNSMSGLWNAVFLEFVQVWVQVVTLFGKLTKNESKRLTIIGRTQTADVFCEEPLRTKPANCFNTICVQRSVLAVNPFLLADDTKVIAREPKGKRVDLVFDFGQLFEIQCANILADDGFWLGWEKISPICVASIRVVVRGPRVFDFEHAPVRCFNA